MTPARRPTQQPTQAKGKTSRPAKPTRRVRSADKGARKSAPYPAAKRTEALAILEDEGLAAAHRATGIPKPTLTRWAKAEGIDSGAAARARTAVATEAVRQRAAEVRLTTVQLLESHVAQAGQYLTTLAGANALAAELIADLDPDTIGYVSTMGGPVAVTPPNTPAAAAKATADLLAQLPLAPRDAEGLLTRAIHDLQLLKGEATERGELTVEFHVPRPTAGATTVVEHTQEIES